jgi:hypothetical protein
VARYGAEVELWYKSDANFDFDEYLKKLKPANVDTIYGMPDSTTTDL